MQKLHLLARLIVLFRNIPCFSRTRFWMLMAAYRLFPGLGSRYHENMFVLRHLDDMVPLKVVDAGGNMSLLCCEMAGRGHRVTVVDQHWKDIYIPKNTTQIYSYQNDLTRLSISGPYDIVVCVSVIEHIGTGEYKGRVDPEGDRKAILEFYRILKPNGKLLITTPHDGFISRAKTYNYFSFKGLVFPYFDIEEYTILRGQICASLVKGREKCLT